MALRRGVAIAGPAVSSTAQGRSRSERARAELSILPPDHDEIGIEGAAVVGAEQQQAVAAAQGVDPALGDLACASGSRSTGSGFGGHDDEVLLFERVARVAARLLHAPHARAGR